jgi:hypothetical protein
VVLVGAEQFLGVLAEQAAPEAEVVGLVPRGLAGGLEHADRDHLVQAARVADPAGLAVVQRERGGAGHAVVPEGQRAGGQGRRSPGEAEGAAEGGTETAVAARAERGGRVLVAGRAGGVGAVEEAAAPEGQPRSGRAGEVGLEQPVGRPVLEDRGGGERGRHVGVALVGGAVGAPRQQLRCQGRQVWGVRRGRVPAEI